MIFLSFSDFPRDPWVLCVVFCPCGAKRHRKSWGKCDFFSISKGRAAWVFEVWRGEDRQILPPPVYGKHNGVMPFGLQNMSLRGAKRRGNPSPLNVRRKLRWMLRRHSRRDRRLKTCHRHVFLTPRRRTSFGLQNYLAVFSASFSASFSARRFAACS
jgi:hypothetical protein